MQEFPRAQEAQCEEKFFQNAITLKKFREIVWQFRKFSPIPQAIPLKFFFFVKLIYSITRFFSEKVNLTEFLQKNRYTVI